MTLGQAPGAASVSPRLRVPPGRRRAAARLGRSPGFTGYALLTIVVLIGLIPIYYLVVVAAGDASTAQDPNMSWIPGPNLWTNIEHILGSSDIPFWKSVLNSVLVAVAVSVSVVFFSTLAGYAFAKLPFKGRRPLYVFVIATTAVPTQLGVVPLYIVMSQLHLAGTLWSVIIPTLVNAFGVFWITQYLEGALPSELIEAARIDGANMFQTFLHVAFPAAWPAAAMLALFTFIQSWTNYFWPFITLNAQNPTLPVALSLLQASHFIDYSLVFAGVLLATLPLVVLFVAAGRQLVAGIMAGAVKG